MMNEPRSLAVPNTTQGNKMPWPAPQDYNEAVQNPSHNFSDAILRRSSVETNVLGLPKARTGAFASVYKVDAGDSSFAVRCFLRNVQDQSDRYRLLSDHLAANPLPCTVLFDYIEQGIKVGGRWLPIQKMEWVNGVSLERFVYEHLFDADCLKQLCQAFIDMCESLRHSGIAHGDLQHGNIFVEELEPGSARTGSSIRLRLVDYDNMFVPAMIGMASNELGHRNYQHPERSRQHFNAALDNFSAWNIYASLSALVVQPALYMRLFGGDDCLLFKQTDFLNPHESAAFAAFERSHELQLVRMSRFVRSLLPLDPCGVPPLQQTFPEVAELPEISSSAAATRSFDNAGGDWLNVNNSRLLVAPDEEGQVNPRSASRAPSSHNQAPASSGSAAIANLLASVITPPPPYVQKQFAPPPAFIARNGLPYGSTSVVVWEPESELMQPLPRRCKLDSGGHVLVIAVYILCLIASLLFSLSLPLQDSLYLWLTLILIGAGMSYLDNRSSRLVRLGTAVLGEVVDKYTRLTGESKVFFIEYSYEREGNIVRSSWNCNFVDYEAARIGDKLTILWDPKDWSNVRPYRTCPHKAIRD
jgi:hypothetical protein